MIKTSLCIIVLLFIFINKGYSQTIDSLHIPLKQVNITTTRLKEDNFKTAGAISVVNAIYQSLVLPCYPETLEELDLRTNSIAHELVQANCGNVLAIAHKGSILGIVAALTGEAQWRTEDLPCGGMIKLVYADGRWSSILEGDTMTEC